MAMAQISTRLALALGGEVWAGESHLHQEDALCGRVPCREGALCMRKLLHGDALWEEPAIQGPHSRKSSLCTGEPPSASLQRAKLFEV